MQKERNIFSYITVVCFLLYIIFVMWVILFKLGFSLHEIQGERVLNLIPFNYEKGSGGRFHFAEVINNVLIFVPVGAYLCLLFRKISFLKKAGLIFASSSVLECAQYILAVGSFDISDLITNTIGGILGISAFLIWRTAFRSKEKPEQGFAILINLITILMAGGVLYIVLQN